MLKKINNIITLLKALLIILTLILERDKAKRKKN